MRADIGQSAGLIEAAVHWGPGLSVRADFPAGSTTLEMVSDLRSSMARVAAANGGGDTDWIPNLADRAHLVTMNKGTLRCREKRLSIGKWILRKSSKVTCFSVRLHEWGKDEAQAVRDREEQRVRQRDGAKDDTAQADPECIHKVPRCDSRIVTARDVRDGSTRLLARTSV
jgi:hypothetical protein